MLLCGFQCASHLSITIHSCFITYSVFSATTFFPFDIICSHGDNQHTLCRCLTKNSTAVIQLDISRPLCMELYQDCRELGRFMLRSGGTTIAAGVVTKVYLANMHHWTLLYYFFFNPGLVNYVVDYINNHFYIS